MTFGLHEATSDPAEVVARVAASRRDRLLRVHRRRLRFEDLEDCYSQATLELLLRARRAPFTDDDHAVHALEQKFLSRIADRRRALAGRSGIEAAMANAVPVDAHDSEHHEIEDRGAGVERQVMVHIEVRRLREVIRELSVDQRLVLHGQINMGLGAEHFCERYGWSIDKFRKVSQRARWRLRALVDEYQSGRRCARLTPDVLALVAKSGNDEQYSRARLHLTNCAACARHAARLDRAQRDVPVVLPPLALSGAFGACLSVHIARLKRLVLTMRHPFSESGTAGVAGVAGGSSAGLATVKAGVLAVCLAGAAGGYAICEPAHVPLLLSGTRPLAHHDRHRKAALVSKPVEVLPPTIPLAPLVLSRHAAERARLEQIRREFGTHRAAAASVPQAAPSLPAQTPVGVRQEQTEFGFER